MVLIKLTTRGTVCLCNDDEAAATVVICTEAGLLRRVPSALITVTCTLYMLSAVRVLEGTTSNDGEVAVFKANGHLDQLAVASLAVPDKTLVVSHDH